MSGLFGPYGHARRVAEIDDALVRQLAHDFVRDRQPADAGVEDADRRGVRHHHLNDADDGRSAGPRQNAKAESRRNVPQIARRRTRRRRRRDGWRRGARPNPRRARDRVRTYALLKRGGATWPVMQTSVVVDVRHDDACRSRCDAPRARSAPDSRIIAMLIASTSMNAAAALCRPSTPATIPGRETNRETRGAA